MINECIAYLFNQTRLQWNGKIHTSLMPPKRPSLRVPTIPLVTGFCESGLKYTCSCHGKLSTIVGTKKSANETTVVTVASFYRLNSVWLRYSGLKYDFLQCIQSAWITWVQFKEIGAQNSWSKCFRLLEICDWLKNTYEATILPHLHQNKAR